jgi:haloalkane dehalogenase
MLPGWLDEMLPFAHRFVDTSGGERVHVMETAGAGQPVLMVHGNPTWGFLWRKVAVELAPGLRGIMPDLVGCGFSDKPRDPRWHTLDNHIRVLGEVIDALGLDRVILVVQDWGGPIGLGALAERRERLAGLVLLNTVVGPPRPGFKPTAFHRFARLPLVSEAVFRLAGFPQNIMARVQGDRASIRGAVAEAYRLPLAGLEHNVAPLALARMVPNSHTHPSIPALRRCQDLIEWWRGPTEIVWGDKDPILGRVLPWLEKLIPAARVTRTAAGHFLQEEVPDAIAGAIGRIAAR